MAATSSTTKKAKKPTGSRKAINSAITGRWMSTKFFGRYWGLTLFSVILIIAYITGRYQCITAMETIKSLEKDLQVVKSERIREKSYYMSGIREKAMQERINSLGLDLQVSEQPPFKIELEE